MRTFRFDRAWVVAAPMGRVHAVLDDLERYPEWWPQVLAVAKIDDETARVLCRSVLPHTLDLVLHATRRESEVLETEITGDLAGWSRFRTSPDGDDATRVVYEQEVVVTHRGLAVASVPLRPLMRWNHDRMMAGCEKGLQARAATAAS